VRINYSDLPGIRKHSSKYRQTNTDRLVIITEAQLLSLGTHEDNADRRDAEHDNLVNGYRFIDCEVSHYSNQEGVLKNKHHFADTNELNCNG
jgi:hypothetical protein